MALFDRTYKLVIGNGGAQGFEITGLRIQFNIQKTAGKDPNKSDIRITNLAKSTREELEKPGTRCVLYAGYVQSEGALKIFEGDVTFAWTQFEGPDVITKFELGEGIASYRDSVVSLSYGPNVNSRQVLEDVARQMGLGLDIAPDAPLRSWNGGRSFHGAARSALDRVTRAAGLSWSIQGGALQVVRSGGATSRRAVVLSADSGMVGSPERERKGNQQVARVQDQNQQRTARVNTATKNYDGWRVTSLLMPTIVPSDPVKLEARGVTGVFVVRELTHRGDSEGGDWQTEMLLVDAATNQRLNQPEAGTTGQRREAVPPPPPAPPPEPSGSGQG